MSIKRVKTGWQVDVQAGGRSGKRLKKTFKLKADALAWERHVRAKVQEKPDWLPERRDKRLLTELCDIWYKNHGVGLNAGKNTYSRLINMCEAMGNPSADFFTAEMFAEYRNERLETGITANNTNRELAYMRAMFNELIRLGVWKKENPLKLLRQFKIQERELSYLTTEQIQILLDVLEESSNRHVTLIAKICLTTGARWGEAENLNISQVKNGQIQFVKTKSSKARSVPIEGFIEDEIKAHYALYGDESAIFTPAYGAFRKGIEYAEIRLPKGQLTHVLRHTFASHFMMNGGNILTLQKVLGHESLTMTMRYAHLSPEHLAEAKRLNPLSALKLR